MGILSIVFLIMIKHVVYLDVKEGGDIEKLNKALMGMKDHIDEIKGVCCGPSLTDRGNGFNYCLIVDVNDLEAKDAYLKHPHHVKIVEEVVKPMINKLGALDFEA